MDGDTFGPYSAREIRDLQLMDDILVTEESMSDWLPAGRFDFDDMVRKELQACVNDDGTINRTPNSLQRQMNSSNQQNLDVPTEIKGWNWGAFIWRWLWGIFNGVYWPLVLILINFIPYVGPIISLVCSIVLGINGNEWAWKGKSWSSVAEFKRVQHNWAIAIWWVLCISLVIGFLLGLAS